MTDEYPRAKILSDYELGERDYYYIIPKSLDRILILLTIGYVTILSTYAIFNYDKYFQYPITKEYRNIEHNKEKITNNNQLHNKRNN